MKPLVNYYCTFNFSAIFLYFSSMLFSCYLALTAWFLAKVTNTPFSFNNRQYDCVIYLKIRNPSRNLVIIFICPEISQKFYLKKYINILFGYQFEHRNISLNAEWNWNREQATSIFIDCEGDFWNYILEQETSRKVHRTGSVSFQKRYIKLDGVEVNIIRWNYGHSNGEECLGRSDGWRPGERLEEYAKRREVGHFTRRLYLLYLFCWRCHKTSLTIIEILILRKKLRTVVPYQSIVFDDISK